MALHFHKMHGLGNDFVIVDGREQSVSMTPDLARKIADRHLGVGCDQLIVVGKSAKVTLGWIAWTSRSSWLGSPPDARFNAARPSSTAENRIDCMTSLAARGMVVAFRWTKLGALPKSRGQCGATSTRCMVSAMIS